MRGSKSTSPKDQNPAEPNSSPLPAQSAPRCSLRTTPGRFLQLQTLLLPQFVHLHPPEETCRGWCHPRVVWGHGTASAGLCPLRSIPGSALPVCGPGWVWREGALGRAGAGASRKGKPEPSPSCVPNSPGRGWPVL